MADGKCGDFILSTIDQLRNRKARPDLDRICHMVQRNYGLNSSLVQIELEKLIVENRVIKVDYKGHTSYRNAAKWSKAKKMEIFTNNNNNDSTTEIKNVESSSALQVLPVKRQGPGRPRKHPLIPPRPEGAPKPARGRPPGKKKPLQLKTEKRKPGRPPGSKSFLTEQKEKLYRQHLSLDQSLDKNSEELLSSALTLPVSTTTEQAELCAYCQSTSSRNLKGEYEALLRCKDCQVTAHPSCMEYTPELAAKSRLAPWQCMSCKNCAVCGDQGNGDTMLFCDSCDKGYHMGCHNPAVVEKPNGLWKCCKCQDNCSSMYNSFQTHPSTVKQRVVNLMRPSNTGPEVDTTGLPTPCDSPAPSDEWKDGDNNTTTVKQYPQAIPDPKDWTIDEVAAFFFSLGFVEQASVFIEQEIDGKSLLLLKRNDVLTGLSIKLGPALKIYSHVEKLQKGVSDNIMHF